MGASSATKATKLGDIIYKRNHLRSVVARIDLVSPIAGVKDQLPKTVSSTALRYYPADEPRRAFQQQVQLVGPAGTVRAEEIVEWHFHGRNREKELVIIPQAVFVEWTGYESYELLRDEFVAVVGAFTETFQEAQISRVGLRYRNVLQVGSAAPLDWGKYVDEKLLGIVSYAAQRPNVMRVVNSVEWAHESFTMKFSFGIPNPDYPAPIRRRSFVLDYDAYRQGLLEATEIGRQLDTQHSAIQEMFEDSITDALRKEMGRRTPC